MQKNAGAETFRDFELSGWQLVAGGYDDHFARLTVQTIPSLLDATGVDEGMELLDIATGPGYVAAAGLERGAVVTAVDFSEVMLAKARERYPLINFCYGDAEELPFDTNRFDSVVMNFGLLHLSRPEKALEEAFRVLHPGGRFGFTVWAPAEYSVGFSIVLKAIQTCGNPNVELPQGPPFFRFSDADESSKCLWQAGFRGSLVTRVDMKWSLNNADEFFNAFYTGTPRTGGILRAQTAEQLAAIKQEVNAATVRYRAEGQQLLIPMAAVLCTAAKL